jgi:hypothetical protein
MTTTSLQSRIPDFLLKYLQLLEIHKNMKKSYDEQQTKLLNGIADLEPAVKEWLLGQPNKEFSLGPLTPEERKTLGTSTTLRYVQKEDSKALSYSKLDENHRAFFTNVVSKQLPELPSEILTRISSLCTDYCWWNREKTVKRKIERVSAKASARNLKIQRLEHAIENVT